MKHTETNVYHVRLSDSGSKLKFTYNLFITFIYAFLIVPHLIVFVFHPGKDKILSDTCTIKNLILSLIFLKHYRNLFYYRIGNIKFLIKWLLPEENSIYLPIKLKLGRTAHFVHNRSSFLNAKSIGDNFVCYQHVTLGSARLGGTQKPVIGNNVTIYTGAVVVGGIRVGDNVNIGANAVIVKDVPSNSTVIGSPAKIIKLKGEPVDMLL